MKDTIIASRKEIECIHDKKREAELREAQGYRHVQTLLEALDTLLTNMTDNEEDEDPDTGERRLDVIAVEVARDAVLRSRRR